MAQETSRPTFRVKVDMVVLGFTVTDSKGKYVNGLKPSDFRIMEDGIAQKLNTFAEGNKPVMQILDDGSMRPLAQQPPKEEAKTEPDVRSDAFVGTNVFVLFDTSNYMYRGFVYASDAIADFVRGLGPGRLGGRLYIRPPKSNARGRPDQGPQRGHSGSAQSGGRG